MPSASSLGIVSTVLPICTLIIFSFLTVQTISGSWSQMFTNMLCMLLGAAATTVLKSMSSIILKYLAPRSNHELSPDIYSLDHGRLNMTLPPQTMWMNMGYWKDTADFPAACEGLMLEVLKTARLLPPEIRPISRNRHQTIRVLDLGFGCGDQIHSLLKLGTVDRGTGGLAEELSSAEPLIMDRYVGITLNRSQFNHAKQRLTDSDALKDSQRVRIFCADAAQPSKWSAELRDIMTLLSAAPVGFSSLHPSLEARDDQSVPETWVLALDTMYHFFPSRKPVLEYAYRELGASIMAFDLLVSDNASLGSRLLLAVLALLMGCPAKTFMTEIRYRKMLKRAGYTVNNIEFRDISDHVFAPLARFLDTRDKGLRRLGLNIGGFVVAKWMFEWWARSGLIRGVIMVAKR